MDAAAIRKQVGEWRATAEQQLARWDGVDPTRLLAACDVIDELLGAGMSGAPRPQLVVEPATLVDMRSPSPHGLPAFDVTFRVVPVSIADGMRLVLMLDPLVNTGPLRIEITRLYQPQQQP